MLCEDCLVTVIHFLKNKIFSSTGPMVGAFEPQKWGQLIKISFLQYSVLTYKLLGTFKQSRHIGLLHFFSFGIKK